MNQLSRISVIVLAMLLCSCQSSEHDGGQADCPRPSLLQQGDTFSYNVYGNLTLSDNVNYTVQETSPLTIEVDSGLEQYSITFNSGICNGPDRGLTWYEQVIFQPSKSVFALEELFETPVHSPDNIESECQLPNNQSLFNYDVEIVSCEGRIEDEGSWQGQNIVVPRNLPNSLQINVDGGMTYELILTSLYLTE